MSGYQISNRFSWKKLAEGCVILDLEKGYYFTLNETASSIWMGLVEGKPPDEISISVAETYTVSADQAAADVNDTVSMLLKEGVLEECAKEDDKE